MSRNILDPTSVSEYSTFVTMAVKHGVSFNDIMDQTARTHGNEFTLKVLNELGRRSRASSR